MQGHMRFFWNCLDAQPSQRSVESMESSSSLLGGAAECLDFSLLFGGSAACHWQQSGGVGVAVQPRFKYIQVTQHLLGASLVVSPW